MELRFCDIDFLKKNVGKSLTRTLTLYDILALSRSQIVRRQNQGSAKILFMSYGNLL